MLSEPHITFLGSRFFIFGHLGQEKEAGGDQGEGGHQEEARARGSPKNLNMKRFKEIHLKIRR